MLPRGVYDLTLLTIDRLKTFEVFPFTFLCILIKASPSQGQAKSKFTVAWPSVSLIQFLASSWQLEINRTINTLDAHLSSSKTTVIEAAAVQLSNISSSAS